MRLGEIATRLGCSLEGDPSIEIVAAAALDDARPGTITFLANPHLASRVADTGASAIVLGPGEPVSRLAVLRASAPYEAFTRVVGLLHPPTPALAGIHPTAVIAPDAEIGSGASIGPLVVVGARATLGRDVVLHSRVTIGAGVTTGDAFVAYAGVVVAEGVRIGDRVVLHPGVVIGSDGFGYLPLAGGIRKIPQVGTVVLEDDVEIGANSCVDRAALGETRVGRGTKIDNLVQIAHGCRIGPGCLIAAQVGLGGGTVVGAGVMVGGQAGSAGHLTIGAGAQIAAKSGVHGDVPAGARYGGYPAVDARDWRRSMGALARLPGVLRRLRRVERALGLGREEED